MLWPSLKMNLLEIKLILTVCSRNIDEQFCELGFRLFCRVTGTLLLTFIFVRGNSDICEKSLLISQEFLYLI